MSFNISLLLLIVLASHGIPLHGYDEKFGSRRNRNYMMLLEIITEFDISLAYHIAKYRHPGSGNTSYLSLTIAEEFLSSLGNTITNKIVCEVTNYCEAG